MRIKLLIIFLLYGCNSLAQIVSYTADIKPLIENNCLPCHAQGNIAPIPLTNYEEVSSYASMIAYVTTHQLMPPWKAEKTTTDLKEITHLDTLDIKLIQEWINQDMPLGETIQDSINVVTSPIQIESDSFDVTFSMEESFFIEADYRPTWQVFVIPTYLEEDLYVNKIKYEPGNRRVVRSAAISIDTTNRGKQYDKTDLDYGYFNFAGLAFIATDYLWYFWTPDQAVWELPKTFVKKIPKGSMLLIHVQYAATGQEVSDSSSLHLSTVEKDDSLNEIKTGLLIKPQDFISGNKIKPHQRVHLNKKVTIKEDILLHSLTPLGQFICKSWEIYAIRGEGERVPILKIPEWDVMWKRSYNLSEPLFLNKGDKIAINAVYDNTNNNPNIPQIAPRRIKIGEGKREEMFTVQYAYSHIIK